MVTLTRVETTSNMIEAKAYISVFPEAKSAGIINALQKSVYDIQYKINRTLRMRPIPKIRFVKETEISNAAKIEELLVRQKWSPILILKKKKKFDKLDIVAE